MGRPLAASTKYPRRKPRPGTFVYNKKSARKANVRALERLVAGIKPKLGKRAHEPPTSAAICALRQFTGMTQTSFAAQLGTSGIVVSQWEIGRRSPAPKYAIRLRVLAAMNDLDMDLITDPDYYRNHVQVHIFAENETRSETKGPA